MGRPKRQAKSKAKNALLEQAKDVKEAVGSGDAPVAKTTGRKRKKQEAKSEKPDVPIKKEKQIDDDDDVPTSSADGGDAKMKKLVFSGSVPVDDQCVECVKDYHVYVDKEEESKYGVYNAMLNQTNIGFNNNKYYLLQVLEHNSKFEYVTWFRWGRVGKVAGKTLTRHGGNLGAAMANYTKKFRDKTGNYWEHLIAGSDFQKVKGKYDLLEMDYGEEEEKKAPQPKKKEKPKKEIESKLDKRVQEVIDLIFNIQEFEACVKELEFDVNKSPLGKLTSKQISAGYETLKKIEKCIQNKKFSGSELSEACNEFYTRIPHDFGMKVPSLIRTPKQLKQKIELLETLGDIQMAMKILQDDEDNEEKNIKDQHYESLGCKLEPYDSHHSEYKMVEEYVQNSHGSTHRQYDLKVENVYKVEREGDEARFKKNVGNRMLLWHGSRLPNWCGILSQGLRIAPPEAPVTGYMFGKGVYFADMVSKSANYCFANQRQPNGFLLLCEVALGNSNDKINADYYADQLPKGKSSTKGLGQEIPDPKFHRKLDCGTIVPLGKPKQAPNAKNCGLMYNEYIVYDVAQIKARYLVKVKFDYNDLW